MAAGVFKDNSIDNVLPLAGVNYFNYDLWGKNLQTNVFFAGAFAFANITDPDVFGGKADAAAEAAPPLSLPLKMKCQAKNAICNIINCLCCRQVRHLR